MFGLMMTLFGTIILLLIYLRYVLGLFPVTIGLLLLPGGLRMCLLPAAPAPAGTPGRLHLDPAALTAASRPNRVRRTSGRRAPDPGPT